MALIAACLLSGCATYQDAKIARNAGIGMVAAGAVLTTVAVVLASRIEDKPCVGDCSGPPSSDGLAAFFAGLGGVGLLVDGAVVWVIGASGMDRHSPEREQWAREQAEEDRQAREGAERERVAEQREQARIEAEAREKRQRREQAFGLLKTAGTAARAGDCVTVIQLAAQVRALDANVNEAWLMRDTAIAACLPPPAN